MADPPPPYVTNERYKSVSRTLFQLGGALVAATVARAYTTLTFDLVLVIWASAAATLIWIGWLVLALLELEN